MTDLILALDGIELDINKRWENGTPHHPKSQQLMELLFDVDLHLCDDFFCWKYGGDGDNGETLMYELDIILEAQDQGKLEELRRILRG